ncbi:urease accessory protein UreD containing protein [Coccidioides posadasii C735 delta SOWgp]|uniref:Urease accessory protein UreD containing protein n=1 Tax=Coccidioides posadasii (strain C735) TaxID=222929 RepID=C5PIZ3_COCP7|nr:urease accessory protein UreD containing protein [Coccidioides posadasii C735 delta SOWgp]EER24496.1 urease accessory protein UreD containing protein [Coccidioides posadasii C735 delta SOWgp]|eukprot:XP_003066641.1 urease accessory protein UreD containing protein [Coccidioides posadasii C735 delta SOWgp]
MPSNNIVNSPFSTSIAPGRGEVVLSILPPGIPSLSTLSYRYPLKLLSRVPGCELDSKFPASATTPVHLYLLSYGGGLLPGDHIDVTIKLRPRSRLIVTTPQGSTKIYKTESQAKRGDVARRGTNVSKLDRSQQIINVELSTESAILYLPDPSVPFERSKYEQIQRFTLLQGERSPQPVTDDIEAKRAHQASLCLLDWVTEGRSARGEKWSFDLWEGRNEIWARDCRTSKSRLLVRDTVTLCKEGSTIPDENGTPRRDDNLRRRQAYLSTAPLSIASRTASHGVLGTLILYGPVFESLSTFFMEKFSSLPRIGTRLSSSPDSEAKSKSKDSDITWTAARVRSGFVIVKFGAPDFESAKRWLGSIFREEGSVEKEFGDEALSYL